MPLELRAPPQAPAVAPSRAPRLAVCLLILSLAVLAGTLGAILWRGSRPATAHPVRDVERTRAIATQLQAAGVPLEAAALYERYLAEAAIEPPARAAVAYSLSTLYLDQGHYERALRWLYEAQADDRGELSEAIGQKIVHALEALGRVHAARAALGAQTQLPSGPGVQHAADDPVVAQLGEEAIYRSQVLASLDSLPPEIGRRFSGPEAYLQQYVADELLWRKAQKLELDQDGEVRRASQEALKRFAIQKFIAREVVGKITVQESDLANFFAANRARYSPPAGDKKAKAVSLSDVRGEVERDYRLGKVQAAYAELVGQELADSSVRLMPERFKEPPRRP
jgi:hypothetical protein